MNHNRRSLDKTTRKKISKEVKKAQKDFGKPEPIVRTDKLTPKDVLKKIPKKVAKTDASLLNAFEKNLEIAKKKKKAPHSKRSTPGLAIDEQDAAPAFVHKEGVRWTKTLTLQNKVKSKSLAHKLAKKK